MAIRWTTVARSVPLYDLRVSAITRLQSSGDAFAARGCSSVRWSLSVIIDTDETRRVKLASCLAREDIPVRAATCLADLETWPVGEVLVTNVEIAFAP